MTVREVLGIAHRDHRIVEQREIAGTAYDEARSENEESCIHAVDENDQGEYSVAGLLLHTAIVYKPQRMASVTLVLRFQP
jgi:hypothetical protein